MPAALPGPLATIGFLPPQHPPRCQILPDTSAAAGSSLPLPAPLTVLQRPKELGDRSDFSAFTFLCTFMLMAIIGIKHLLRSRTKASIERRSV